MKTRELNIFWLPSFITILLFMKLILVGGHSRNIGKTSVVAGIVKALVELNWTAIKITQTGHKICASNGKDCGCEVPEHEFLLTEETEKSMRADTPRFLLAGAKRALWLRTRQGELVNALSKLKTEIATNDYVIIESNSLRKFIVPDLYLQVLDPTKEDFKISAQEFLDLADAYIVVDRFNQEIDIEKVAINWQNISLKNLMDLKKPWFLVQSEKDFISQDVIEFIKKHLNK